MKITSYAETAFAIDGVVIVAGTHKYGKLDTNKREVRYQLAVLKEVGTIDYRENIPRELVDQLPIQKDEKPQPTKEVAKNVTDAKKPNRSSKGTRKN